VPEGRERINPIVSSSALWAPPPEEDTVFANAILNKENVSRNSLKKIKTVFKIYRHPELDSGSQHSLMMLRTDPNSYQDGSSAE
jgi:hypothetical protein